MAKPKGEEDAGGESVILVGQRSDQGDVVAVKMNLIVPVTTHSQRGRWKEKKTLRAPYTKGLSRLPKKPMSRQCRIIGAAKRWYQSASDGDMLYSVL